MFKGIDNLSENTLRLVAQTFTAHGFQMNPE